MNTARLETFADGVFAIAATLLILSVDQHFGSCAPPGATLARQLVCSWPSYVAYIVSFLTIGIIWVNHHTVMDQIDHADRTFLMITVGFLMIVAFIPFPTRLVAENIRGDGAKAATIAYGITLTLTAVLFNAVWFYASRGRRLLRADADPRAVTGITRTYLPGPWIYLGAALVAFASPTASALLYLALAALYVFESSIFGRDRSHRSTPP